MVSIHLEHIIAKKNEKILKNMVSGAKKRHFLTFFAVYSKRDFGLGWVHLNAFSRAAVEDFFKIFSRDGS